WVDPCCSSDDRPDLRRRYMGRGSWVSDALHAQDQQLQRRGTRAVLSLRQHGSRSARYGPVSLPIEPATTPPIRSGAQVAPLSFSVPELEALEAAQFLLDEAFVGARAGRGEPVPGLDQQFARRAIGLQVESRHDIVADQHGQGEVAELALCLGDVSFEHVIIIEEEFQACPLNDDGVERIEDVYQRLAGIGDVIERLGRYPMRNG